MVYTVEERIELIFLYGAQNENAARTAESYNARQPGRNASHRYVIDLVSKFRETGSVKNKTRKNSRILDDLAQIEVIGHYASNPNSSVREVSAISGYCS